jgi:membrane-associated phospholipid phosphatase
VASWVAASRVEMKRHFVSDVVAGATIGILAGRSVTVGTSHTRFAVVPMVVPGGVGIGFTKQAK